MDIRQKEAQNSAQLALPTAARTAAAKSSLGTGEGVSFFSQGQGHVLCGWDEWQSSGFQYQNQVQTFNNCESEERRKKANADQKMSLRSTKGIFKDVAPQDVSKLFSGILAETHKIPAEQRHVGLEKLFDAIVLIPEVGLVWEAQVTSVPLSHTVQSSVRSMGPSSMGNLYSHDVLRIKNVDELTVLSRSKWRKTPPHPPWAIFGLVPTAPLAGMLAMLVSQKAFSG